MGKVKAFDKNNNSISHIAWSCKKLQANLCKCAMYYTFKRYSNVNDNFFKQNFLKIFQCWIGHTRYGITHINSIIYTAFMEWQQFVWDHLITIDE